MPQLPFRQPANYEDAPEEQWSPPNYVTESEKKEWEPPSYAKPPEESAKPGVFSRIGKKISGDVEGITKSLGQAKETTKSEIDKFITDTLAEKSSHPYIKRLLTSQDPTTESILPTTQEAGIKEPSTYWGGFRKGLYEEWLRPLASAAGVAGLIGGEEAVLEHPSAAARLPIRQVREIPYRMEEAIQAREPVRLPERVPEREPPIKQPFVSPFDRVKAEPPPISEPIVDEAGREIAPPQTPFEREPSEVRAKTTEQQIYDIARERKKMGLDRPEKISAKKPLELETSPDNPNYAKVPFPVADEEVSKTLPTNIDYSKPEIGRVPLNKLTATQDTVTKDVVDTKVGRAQPEIKELPIGANTRPPTDVPAIVRDGDNMYLIGGTHEATAAIMRGDTDIQAVIYDVKSPRISKAPEAVSKAEWKPPSYAKPLEEPLAARTESGKLAIGADVKSLGKVLGTSLYKGDIAPIATKELLQNSIDATRHLGAEGKIDVVLDRGNNIIHVNDNGKGLTRQELESVFTDLGASGKREDVSAAGGFGLAKAAPLLGGKKVEVKTISRDLNGKLHEYSFEGTPDELLEGVDIKHRIPDESENTGTSVKVHVPEDSDFYAAKDFVRNLSEHSQGVQGQVRLAESYSKYDPRTHKFTSLPKGGGKSIAILDSPSAQTELIEPVNSERRIGSSIKLNLSNNGMYQGTKTLYLDHETPNIPTSLTVDIKSKVPEGHVDYPFTANREELRGTVEKQVQKYIDENIIKPSIRKRKDELEKLYNSMQEITVGKGQFPNTFGRKITIYDPKGQITPGEMKTITSSPAFHTLAGNIGSILDEAMKVAGTPAWTSRLEKSGIIFEEKLHGIHLPNPASGKSAILINPFVAMDRMSPDEASASIFHTILHEMAHIEPDSPGHNELFTIRLGDIHSKFGARRTVEAYNAITKAIADPNTEIYHPEIQEILSTFKASRGREATTEDLLSGTGISSRVKRGGEGNIPPSNQPGAERVAAAVDKLFKATLDAKGKVVEQEKINKIERARRFAAFSDVGGEGVDWARKALSTMKGEFEKIEPGEKLGLNPQETNSLFTAIKRARITEPEKLRSVTTLFKLMNGERTVRSELQVLDDVFGNDFSNKIIEMHGGIGLVGIKLSKLANTTKSMENALSLAAPLRHGIGMIHRKEFYPAFRDMFKFFGNKEFYDASMRAIEEHPKYLEARESGLFLPKAASGADEEFLDSYVGNIPRFTGIPQAVAASKRAYTGFLNKLKFDVYKNMSDLAEDLGYDLFTDRSGKNPVGFASREARGIANFINTFTGRGDLGRLNKMTTELNLLMWSPRMMASRLQMFTSPKLYMDLPKEMRMEGLKSLLAIASLGTIIDTAASYAGAKVSTNILSTDFGKSRFGTRLIDPWGGFQQYVVGAARFLAGKTDIPTPTSRLNIAGRFLANKESPAANLAHTFLTAKKFTGGGKFTTEYGKETSVQNEVAQRFIPIFVQDLMELTSTEPDWANNIGLDAAMGVASLTGMAQDYPEKKKLGLRKMKLNK